MGVSRVLIVGGGITGSVAAAALAQRGAEVDLAEIRTEWTGTQLGIQGEPRPAGISIWRVLADREPDMTCSELFYEGPRYRAGYSPISAARCYAYLLDEDTPEAGPGNRPPAAVLRERSAGYGGHWGLIRDRIRDDTPVNYQRTESLLAADPWYRDRVIIIGDAAHACPPQIAQGAAMCAEDAIVLAELVTGTDPVEAALKDFMHRRLNRVRMVVESSLKLAAWDINPDTPGADPAGIMPETLTALQVPA